MEATYLATGVPYNQNETPSLTTLTPVIEVKGARASKNLPHAEATNLSSGDRASNSESADRDAGDYISDKRTTLQDMLIVTTIVVCNRTENTIQMTVENYEARDNWLHDGHPVIDELDYKDWILSFDMLDEVWTPGQTDPYVQLLNTIRESTAECQDCACERDEDGEFTGDLVATADDRCSQEKADECSVTFGCACVDWATDKDLNKKLAELEPPLRPQRPQRWLVPGTKEPYYLEGPESLESERSYWPGIAVLAANLAFSSTTGRIRHGKGRPELRAPWFGIVKRDNEESQPGLALSEHNDSPARLDSPEESDQEEEE
ncbi:hypothetical protein TWF481_010740 [Arthrobotrys musiformis]|uniref:Uncharacterized protein n=1 Tax=Arthrobotrys musiformis TaxID=47236 RepID=A0AAV9W1N6_9PEZI